MLDALLRPAVLGPVLVVLGYIVYQLFIVPSQLPDLPLIGARKGDVFPLLQAKWRNFLDFKAAVDLAYREHKNEAVLVPLLGNNTSVMVPVEETQWLVEQPDHLLSMHENAIESLQTDLTTTDPMLVRNPTHHKLITTTLTNQIGNLVPDVADECAWSFEQHWKSDTDDWSEVCVYDTMRHVIGSVTNRVFVGLPCCRDPRLLDAGMAFAQDIPLSSMALRLFWTPLRRLVAPLITIPNRKHTNEFLEVIRPEIQRRLREYDERGRDPEKNSQREPPRNDYLEWTVKQAKESGDPYMYDWKTIGGRILLLNFAAIHTSSFAITSVIFDLVYSKKEYIQELRDEVRSALAEHGGVWSKQALAKMEKLDSTLRESARLNSFVTIGVARTVTAAEGVTTPSGVRVPKGTQVVAHAYPVFRDPAHYEDPHEFKPFRFAQRRQEEGVEYVKRARNAFATTSNEFLAFGHGRNACPGRFFAANEIKLLLGHLVLHYDLEAAEPGDRPRNKWIGVSRIPPMEAKIRIRKRKVDI